jgi:hypothetical protein
MTKKIKIRGFVKSYLKMIKIRLGYKRVLLYTDSRGDNVPGTEYYKHYSKRLDSKFVVDAYLCPEKWTTILDFLQLYYQVRSVQKYDWIILHCGIVDASPRHQSIAINKIYFPKKNIFDQIFGEETEKEYLLSDLGVEYEGEKTINMYSLSMAKEKLLPVLRSIPNLIWISSNRIVPGWRGNYWKDRPANIKLVEEYANLFLSELPPSMTIDLMQWDYDLVKKNTYDNIHPNQFGSDQIYQMLLDVIGRSRNV